MKWLLISAPILVGLLAALGTIVAAGALLPRGHSASRSAKYPVPPERLWAVISNFKDRASWAPGVKGVERLADRNGHAVWKDIRADGWGMPLEVEAAEPPRRLVTRIADESLPFGGTWTWEIVPEGEGCRLRITENGEVKSPVFRYFAALSDMSATMREQMIALGKPLGTPAVTVEP